MVVGAACPEKPEKTLHLKPLRNGLPSLPLNSYATEGFGSAPDSDGCFLAGRDDHRRREKPFCVCQNIEDTLRQAGGKGTRIPVLEQQGRVCSDSPPLGFPTA